MVGQANYYETAKLQLLPFSQFRLFKFSKTVGNKKIWINIRDKITSVEKLRWWILKLEPSDIYQTRSCFLDPTILHGKYYGRRCLANPANSKEFQKLSKGRKIGWDFSANCFLWTDFFIETDTQNRGNYDNILQFFEDKKLSDLGILNTNRGFHFYSFDWRFKYIKKQFANPKMRENYYKQMSRKFLWELKNDYKVDFDFDVCCDMRRVSRVPFSMTSKGNICSFIATVPSNSDSPTDHQKMTESQSYAGCSWKGDSKIPALGNADYKPQQPSFFNYVEKKKKLDDIVITSSTNSLFSNKEESQ